MMNRKVFRLIILGAPGSGKGTISKRIVRDFGLKYLASGDLLRAQILERTEAGEKAKSFIERGQLVPDHLMIKLITAELNKLRSYNWLLDGYPRTAAQARDLQTQDPISLALNLDVPNDVIVERIKGRWTHLSSGRIYHNEFNPPKKTGIDDITGETLVQRNDDKPEVVTERLQTYSNNMKSILSFYRDLNLLQEFHGTESNQIWPEIKKYLALYLKPDTAS